MRDARYMAQLDPEEVDELLLSEPLGKFRNQREWSDVMHCRLVATLLSTKIMVFVERFGRWKELLPLPVDPEFVPERSENIIYLYLAGDSSEKGLTGHFMLIKNVDAIVSCSGDYGKFVMKTTLI